MECRILVATANPGKVSELKRHLGPIAQWLSLSDFDGLEQISEDGVTFADNAAKKATHYANVTGLLTIADDSGLIVDALGGEPGVRSARFCGGDFHRDRSVIDHDNVAKILQLLQGVPSRARTARFACCLCLAGPSGILAQTQGVLEGLITDKEIGGGGFGYDPIFWVPSLQKTLAQLSLEEKNLVSHRGRAIVKLKPLLQEVLSHS